LLSAFYPGAGIDLHPPVLFRTIKTWHYMDSQPNRVELPDFINQMKQVMAQNGYDLQSIQENVYTFYHPEHGQTIHYETNSVFPDACQDRHYVCDTLVCCGFDMGKHAIEFITRFPHIITDNQTVFEPYEETILLTKDVYTMVMAKNWEYWNREKKTTSQIQCHIHIVNRFLTYDDIHSNTGYVNDDVILSSFRDTVEESESDERGIPA